MARARKSGRHLGREHWRGLVAELETSPLSPAEFAASRGVKLGTLRSWVYRLRAEAQAGAPLATPGSFVEVVAVGAAEGPAGAAGCTVRVGAAELSFARVPSAPFLAELLMRVGA